MEKASTHHEHSNYYPKKDKFTQAKQRYVFHNKKILGGGAFGYVRFFGLTF